MKRHREHASRRELWVKQGLDKKNDNGAWPKERVIED